MSNKYNKIFDKIWIPCEITILLGFILALWGNGWWFVVTLPALLVAIVSATILTNMEQKESTE